MKTIEITTTKFAIFKGKKVRKVIFQNEWWFSVVDIVEALTDSNKLRVYWNAMKTRVKVSDGIELSTICRQLIKSIEFDVFKLVFNYGSFAINRLSITEESSIVQNEDEVDNFQTGLLWL